jgi:hypothetical protein
MKAMQPNSPYQPVPPPQPHEYDFLVNSQKPPKRSLNLLPSNSSMPIRIAVVVGGLLILIIVFSIIRSVLSGGGNTPALTTVAQDQQEIIHLTQNATQGQQISLSTTNQNFAVTADASLTSAQSQLLDYMKANGHKVKLKTLDLEISTTLDTQIKTAITNSTYDSTFKSIMQNQLSDYQQALRSAYQQTSGAKGRKLLSDQFNGAQLLIKQLNSPAS